MEQSDISMKKLTFSVSWPSNALQASVFQNFGAQDFKAKSTRIPLCGLDQPVQCFRVRIAYAMIEIGNDRLIPVIHGGQQRLERLFQVGRDTRSPVLVGGFGLQTVAFLPDVENAFFQPVGGFQIREVLCPGFHDQPLGLVQIAVTMQENRAVVHQSTPGSVGEFRSQSLAHRFKTFIGHLHNVKVVDHHLGVWQDDLRGVKVGTPHVHASQGNLILMGQTIQITGSGGFVPVAQEVYDPAIADVADHATGFVEQVNFIDAERGTRRFLLCLHVFGGFLEDAPNGSFIDPNVIGNAGKSAPDRLAGEVEHQALRHQMMLVHFVKRLKKGLEALSALIAPSNDIDPCVLASNGDVHEQLWLGPMSIQQGTGAMWAARNHRLLLSGDLEVMRMFLYGQNAPMGPAKNIQ